MSPTICSGPMSNETPSSARMPPKRIATSRIDATGDVMLPPPQGLAHGTSRRWRAAYETRAVPPFSNRQHGRGPARAAFLSDRTAFLE